MQHGVLATFYAFVCLFCSAAIGAAATDPVSTSETQDGFPVNATVVVAVLILIGAGLTGIWIVALRRAIDSRTASLDHEIRLREQAQADLQETRDVYQSLVDALPQTVYRINRAGNVTFINDTYLKLTGMRREDLIGRSASDVYPPELAEKYRADDESVFLTGETYRGTEDHVLPNSDEHSYVEVVKVPVRNDSGEIVELQGMFWDVTDRVSAEKKLKQALLEAEQASRAKSDFLANMSHELRTPLNSIIGFSEIMTNEHYGSMGNEKYAEYSGDVYRTAKHLLTLINELLDIVRIESGHIDLQEEVVDLEALFEDCIHSIQPMTSKKKQTVETSIASGAEAVLADARLTKQMLLNLLSNATKFTADGGSITVSAFLDPLGDLVIRIRDNGNGIPPEKLANVTQPFVQLDEDAYRTQEGTGLGLSVTKGFAEAHGAKLKVESEVGVGTSASIDFPAYRVPAEIVETAH